MADPARKVRGLIYTLADVEKSLRADGRTASALEINALARKFPDFTAEEFLNESRSTLEAVLLGERNLSGTLIFELLDAMSAVDAVLAEVTRTS